MNTLTPETIKELRELLDTLTERQEHADQCDEETCDISHDLYRIKTKIYAAAYIHLPALLDRAEQAERLEAALRDAKDALVKAAARYGDLHLTNAVAKIDAALTGK